MRGFIRILALTAAGLGLAGCVVYPASYYGPPARYGYYAPPPPPPYYGQRYWR
jgi:hypothetical protein